MVNKIGDGDETRSNSTLGDFSVTPFSKDEEVAKARVQEVRSQMTIDKIGEGVKGNLKSLIGLNEASLDELRKVFDNCESGSLQELSIINNIKNNPKTTPEDLDYYFFNLKEGSEAEFLVAKALITHPNLTQEIFDKNYGMAMQKGGLVFDLFEAADQERSKKAKEEKEKNNETMQGSISKLFYKEGLGVIHGNNGKNYLLHFSQMKEKAEAFSELLIDSKVKFKLLPSKEKNKEPHKIRRWLKLNEMLGMNLDPDFMATDIVVED